ncbi:MAG: xanthine dehydrogenase family protein subunit M [Deltaproteobacteria bacterium]|nr:xanthine dehydrogenase family protein subunit M [Deltaproteobacteria bacterium]
MNRYDYHRPTTLTEALARKAETKDARFIAGGTDLMVRIRGKDVVTPALISLRSIPEIAGVSLDGGACIGAATTIGDLVRHEGLGARYPALAQAARRIGSQQIRNAGTIGGNVCNASPCADTALPLLVHEARVGLASAGGKREIPIADLFCGPRATCLKADEIMTHVLLPAPSPKAKAVFLKKGRVMMDLSVASVAVLLELNGDTCVKARVAAGSVGPTPLRLKDAEAILEGKRITDDLLTKACEAAMRGVSPITDVRSTAEYRRHIVGVFLKRAVLGLLGRETA